MSGRLEKLVALEGELEELMGKANSRAFASLSKEYRAVIREIDELEAEGDAEDPIAALVAAGPNAG